MVRALRRSIVQALLLAVVGPAAAQSGPPADAASTPSLARGDPDAAVAAAVARRWGVEPGRVVVEWGAGPTLADHPVRLLGSGVRGAFVAEARGPDGTLRRRVRAGVRRTVAVAARDLERGSPLAPTDIAYRDTVLWGSAETTAVQAGWVAARRIPAGSLLDRPAVAPPAAVVAGRPVTLVWRGRGLEITARGTASGNAALGDRVAVRTESGRRLWGRAVSSDRVEIEGSRQ